MQQPLTPIIKNLLILNVVVFVLVQFVISDRAIVEMLIMYPPGDDKFRAWQVVTHAFMHADETHIIFNMLGLYFLGPMVEMRLGSKNFLILYFVSIFGALLFHLGSPSISTWQMQQAYEAFLANPDLQHFDSFFRGRDLNSLIYETYNGRGQVINRENAARIAGELQNQMAFGDNMEKTANEVGILMQEVIKNRRGAPMLGASGAVSGAVAAFAVIYPNLKLSPLFIPIGFKAKYFVPFIFLIDLALGILNFAGDNIAHFAHIGGAVTGAIIAYFLLKKLPPPNVQRWN